MTVPLGIDPEHCWVYVVRGPIEQPERLIAQGTFDERALADGFRLLGARSGDTVVLIGEADQDLIVLAGKIEGIDPTTHSARIPSWISATPPALDTAQPIPPSVDVLPSRMDADQPGAQAAQVSVRVRSDDRARPNQVWMFPHGQIARSDVIALGVPDKPDWTSAAQTVA